MIRAALIASMLAGCASFGSGNYNDRGGIPLEIITRAPDLYTRSEIDAINAETQCRSLARTPLQAQRCGIRR